MYLAFTSAPRVGQLLTALAGSLLASFPPRLQAQTNCAPPPSGLVAWWKADGDATDSFSTNNGTPLYGVSYDAGEVGQGFRFVGANNQRVYIPDNPAFQLTNSLTIEGWFKINGGWSLLARGDNRPGLDPYSLSLQPDLTLAFTIEDASNTAVAVRTPNALPTGVWLHLAATLDGTTGTMSIYTNGNLAAQATTAIRPMGPLNPAYDPSVCIGNVAGQNIAYPFDGWADEVGLYSRALSQSELQAIFNAGSLGKCPAPPVILIPPADQTATIDNTAHFSVFAAGAPPLTYQWTLFNTNLLGATNSTLVLPNVSFADAGPYAVQVSNAVSSVSSSNAFLTVLQIPPCVTPYSNLISWWQAESNAFDQITGNKGSLVGNVTFTPGRVGQGFLFDGNASAVIVSNPPSLQLQDFSIEAWIRRGNASIASSSPGGGLFLSYGHAGYGFGVNDNGTLFVSRIDIDEVSTTVAITDTNLHHVAVTKTGTTVIFYIDAIPYPAPVYSTVFGFTTPVAIGARGDNLANSFLGMIDELCIYNRALSPAEIQAIYTADSTGKCLLPVPPFIISSPASLRLTTGGSTTLTAVAGGSAPLTYQWMFNGTNLAGATSSSLTLTSVQINQSGSYSITVTNSGGFAISASAQVTVVYPPATVRLAGTNVFAGTTFTLPVTLVANGNENAIGFSIAWDSLAGLSFAGAALGSGAPGATFLLNTSQVFTNRLGLAIALPPGATFNPGTQQVALVSFAVPPVISYPESNLRFLDAPTPRQLWDPQLNPLTANFIAASINISAAPGFEGDVYPRPNGDRSASLIDWLQMGRYAARLDYPTNASEFQRADCAPRSTLGDGVLKVTDWVQVGRYATGLDPLTLVGGPTNEIAGPGPGPSATRLVSLAGTTANPGDTFTVSVALAAQRGENALGASISFDPSLAAFVAGALGLDASGATLYLNSSQAASGRLGFALAFDPGATLLPGNKELVRLTFRAVSSGNFTPSFTDFPVPREASDASANSLPVSFVNSSIPINTPPLLAIAQADQMIALSWPLWASNFVLQQATGNLLPSDWITLPMLPAIISNQNSISLPITNSPGFFRLLHP